METSDKLEQLILSGDGAFFTVQGEGPTMGEPAVFVRLNECNLTCSYCDTPYTWRRSDAGYEERRKISSEALIRSILDTNAGRSKRLVITGGEPLLQQRGLRSIFDSAEFYDWDIEIETNGTIEPILFAGRERVQINCSPKLSNAGVVREKRICPDVLAKLATSYFTYFKFVVSTEDHIREIVSDFLPLLNGLPDGRIYLSPEGIDVSTIDEVRARIVGSAGDHGFILGDRQHIRLFGNKRRT